MNRQLVAIVADTHCDESSRFDEHNSVMGWIANDAKERGCTTMLHGGDIYERKSTPLERRAVADWCQLVAESMPLVLVAGNHDNPDDVAMLGRLEGAHRIVALTRPSRLDIAGISVLGFPWPRKANMLAACGADLSHVESDQQAVHAMRLVLHGLGTTGDEREGVPRIFLGHVMARGSKTSLSQPPLVGSELELSLDDIRSAEADLYCLGHIHLQQDLEPGSKAPILYPGAPRHCNWGELEEKGYIVASFEGAKLTGLKFVPTPCRNMVSLEGTFHAQQEGFYASNGDPVSLVIEEGGMEGCEVRLRYRCTVDERTAAKACAAIMVERLNGYEVHSVKVEERVTVEARARAPEVARAVSVAEKLGRYWDSQGDAGPSDDERARALGNLESIEVRP